MTFMDGLAVCLLVLAGIALMYLALRLWSDAARDGQAVRPTQSTRENRVVVATFGKPNRDHQGSRRGSPGDPSQPTYRVRERS